MRKETHKLLASIVLGRLRGRTFRRNVALGHTAIDNEVRTVDEAALIAGKEEDRLGLLDSFAKATSREMDLTAVALRSIVTEPVLKEGSAFHVSA